MDKKDLSPVFENYRDYFNDLFFTELQVTKNWWQKFETDIPVEVDPMLFVFEEISSDKTKSTLLPDVFKLYSILLTLPVSTSSFERQFSILRRIKNYLRNRSLDKRTSTLCLASSLKQVCKELDISRRVERFKEIKQRRLLL
jgi:hypothetical protein